MQCKRDRYDIKRIETDANSALLILGVGIDRKENGRMENLINRARASMNLILVATLLLSWGVFRESPDVISLGLNIHSLVSESVKPMRTPAMSAFLDDIAVSQSKGLTKEQAVAIVQVANLLSFREANFATLFLFKSPEPSRRSGQLDLANRLTRDFEKIENFKEIKPRFKPYARLMLSAKAERLENYLSELERLFQEAKISEAGSLKDLEEKVSLRIKLPLIGESIAAGFAITLISLGLLGPYLYLLSTSAAIRGEIAFLTERKGLDWVFFHPGTLGVSIGVLWVSGPGIVATTGLLCGKLSGPEGIGLVIVLIVAGALSARTAIITRKAF